MKTKSMIPIIATGVVGAGSAVLSCFEIRRLNKLVSAKDKVIECCKKEVEAQEKLIEKYKDSLEAKDEVIVKSREYIEKLEQLIESDKKLIALQKEEIAALQNSQKKAAEPSPEPNSPLLSADTSDESVHQKRVTKNNKGYVFQYDSELKLVAKYSSLGEACVGSGVKYQSSIRKVLNGVNCTAGGYFWSRGNRPLKKFPDKWIAMSQTKENEN